MVNRSQTTQHNFASLRAEEANLRAEEAERRSQKLAEILQALGVNPNE